MKHITSSAYAIVFAAFLTLLTASPASAGGVVTDCTTYGPGPGTLATAVETEGLVTFACSGTIVIRDQIFVPGHRLVIDGSGQTVILSGGNQNRLFNVGGGATLELHRITLTNGNAGSGGGGAITTGGYVTITNSALLSNTAAYGGALEIYNGGVLIQNSTLAGNQVLDPDPDLGGGGAINQYYNIDASNDKPLVVIQNSTIAYNYAVKAGREGIWQENGILRLQYNVIAHNGTGNCKIDAPHKEIQFFSTGNLDNDGTCSPAIQADPALLPLGSYGANTPMFALQPNSPAIDAAPANTCAGTVDQRSVLRPRDGNRDGTAGCDLGAYEYGDRYLAAAANGDGLAGYWKFDETGGASSLDSAGHNLLAVLQEGASFTAAHAPLLFVAPNSLQSSLGAGALVNDAPALNPVTELTVAAWVKLSNTGGTQAIASKLVGDAAGAGYALLVRDGALSAEAWDLSNQRHVITSSITPGTWLHVAMTYKANGAMAAYINGRQAGTKGVASPLGVSGAPLRMAVDGAIDDVRGMLAAIGLATPALEFGLRWLEQRAPACPQPTLVHGDFRIGNVLVGLGGLSAVIDWEFAHVGDPHEDLAWACVRDWRFGNDALRVGGVGELAPYIAAYQAASGRSVDGAALRFWEILGNVRWAATCHSQAHRHLSGADPSVEYASLGRRAAEMELEFLSLIEEAAGS